MLRQTLQRGLKVRQMLAVVDGCVADDVDGDDTIFVHDGNGLDDEGLVDCAAHGDGVVSGAEDEVGDGGVADGDRRGEGGGGQVVCKGDVAHVEGEDGGVGDVDFADHVGAVDGVGGEFDAEGGDVEAGEFVEAVHRGRGVVGDGRVREFHLVESGAAVDVDLDGFVVEDGDVVGCEGGWIGECDVLVDQVCAGLGRVQGRELHVGVSITAAEREGCIEGIESGVVGRVVDDGGVLRQVEPVGGGVAEFERVDDEGGRIDAVLRDPREGDIAQAYRDDDDAGQEQDQMHPPKPPKMCLHLATECGGLPRHRRGGADFFHIRHLCLSVRLG